MRRPVLAANWKMHYGPRDAAAFASRFAQCFPPSYDRSVILFPPSVSIAAVAAALADRPELMVGAQNIYPANAGAFTGEISGPMAREAGARVVLVGHSERRHLFCESDADTGPKCAAALQSGLVPMLCVGEHLAEREAGDTDAVVLRQLAAALDVLDSAAVASLLVAYEPVWAIGTGRTASPQDASAAHAVIRADLRARVGDAASRVPILYGGSVNDGNARALLAAPDVDGVLVGGASLDLERWLRIATAPAGSAHAQPGS